MDNKKVLSIYVQMNVYCLIFHGILRHAFKIWIKAWLASCLRKQYIPFRVSQAQLRVKNVEIPFKPIFAHFSHSIQFSLSDSMRWKKGVLILAINNVELFWCQKISKRGWCKRQVQKVPIICISSASNLQ